METYVKICPGCQTSTALQAVRCHVCGYVYRTRFDPAAGQVVAPTAAPPVGAAPSVAASPSASSPDFPAGPVARGGWRWTWTDTAFLVGIGRYCSNQQMQQDFPPPLFALMVSLVWLVRFLWLEWRAMRTCPLCSAGRLRRRVNQMHDQFGYGQNMENIARLTELAAAVERCSPRCRRHWSS
jgi:hypothetical protein